MAVGSVSFGQNQLAQPQKSSGVMKGTVISAGIGAAVMGGINYAAQKSIIKNPTRIIESLKQVGASGIRAIKEAYGNTTEAKQIALEYGRVVLNKIRGIRDFAAAGKIDFKSLGKTAGVGALVVGGIYLAYRGIKALFTSKEA